jgi:carbonic anhydrase
MSLPQLIKGNKEFVNNKHYKTQRLKTAPKQHPHTMIVSCADSRVPPEIIFQELNLGQLFILRVAGPALSQCDFDTIKYGIEILKIKQVIVLGHTDCGAVTAVWQCKFHEPASLSDEDQRPQTVKEDFPCLFKYISPSCVKIDKNEDRNIQISMKNNVTRTKHLITKHLPIKAKHVHTAYYDLKSGKVNFFCKH